MTILHSGSSGTLVKKLQQDLQLLGYQTTVDGMFGSGTTAAVMAFQQAHGLSRDGVAGELTQNKLASLIKPLVQGIDISHLNGPVDWTALANDEISFVFCKASQGAGFSDQQFQRNYESHLATGIPMGAYHFLNFNDETAQQQAANFLKCGVDFSKPGILPPVVDIEWQVPSDLNQYILDNRNACINLINDWLTIITEKTGRTPIIYSNANFWHDYLGNPATFSRCPLWIAAYQHNQPILPPGWSSYAFWQFTGTGGISSINGQVDRDVYNGTMNELKQLANS